MDLLQTTLCLPTSPEQLQVLCAAILREMSPFNDLALSCDHTQNTRQLSLVASVLLAQVMQLLPLGVGSGLSGICFWWFWGISGIQKVSLHVPMCYRDPVSSVPIPLDGLMTISSMHSRLLSQACTQTNTYTCTHARSLLIAKSNLRAWPASVIFLNVYGPHTQRATVLNFPDALWGLSSGP